MHEDNERLVDEAIHMLRAYHTEKHSDGHNDCHCWPAIRAVQILREERDAARAHLDGNCADVEQRFRGLANRLHELAQYIEASAGKHQQSFDPATNWHEIEGEILRARNNLKDNPPVIDRTLDALFRAHTLLYHEMFQRGEREHPYDHGQIRAEVQDQVRADALRERQ